MKRFVIAVLLTVASALQAYAFDYNVGQVPCVGCSVYASTPANWQWGSTGGGYGGNIKSSPFADTMTFSLGNWTENYGTYEYTQSTGFSAWGATHCGHYCSEHTIVTLTSAVLDGVSLTKDASGKFSLLGSLSPGSHTVAVTGTAVCTNCNDLNYATWDVEIDGVLYTLVPNPPSTGGGDD